MFPSPAGTVTGIANATAVAMGQEFACAVMGDGTVQCWGTDTANLWNTVPASVDGGGCFSGPCSSTPIPVGGVGGATALAAGGFACVIISGRVECWDQ